MQFKGQILGVRVQWNLIEQSFSKKVSLLITVSIQCPKTFANTHCIILIHSLNGHSLLHIAVRPTVPIATNMAIPSLEVAVGPIK